MHCIPLTSLIKKVSSVDHDIIIYIYSFLSLQAAFPTLQIGLLALEPAGAYKTWIDILQYARKSNCNHALSLFTILKFTVLNPQRKRRPIYNVQQIVFVALQFIHGVSEKKLLFKSEVRWKMFI